MTNTLNKYPVFTLDTNINKKYGIGYLINNDKESKQVNESGWEVLKYCEGVLSIKEIADLLSVDWEITPEEIVRFLEKFEKNGFIELEENQSYRKIVVEGNWENVYPSICSLQITDCCNLQCIYCYGEFNPHNRQFIDITKVEPLFKLLTSIGVTGIDLTGGEPLTHPHFLDILTLAVKYFESVGLISNGALFNDSIYELLKHEEYRKKISVQISIDGYSEEVNGVLRGVKNTFHKSADAIRKLVELGIMHRVGIVVTRENVHELAKTVDFVRSLGSRDFGISIANPIGKGVNLTYPDGKSLINFNSEHSKELLNILADVNSKNKDFIMSAEKFKGYNPDFDTKTRNCGGGWRSISIDPAGNIYFCTLLGNKGPKIGNVFTDDLSKIFVKDNPIINFFLRFEKNLDEPDCADCYYKSMCSSCLTKIYMSNIDRIRKGEELCPIVVKSGMDKVFDFKSNIKVNI